MHDLLLFWFASVICKTQFNTSFGIRETESPYPSTVTDGKDVKPYHGTEKGVTDYANEHGKQNKDQGERFKTSKRKNKGRKVTVSPCFYKIAIFPRRVHCIELLAESGHIVTSIKW